MLNLDKHLYYATRKFTVSQSRNHAITRILVDLVAWKCLLGLIQWAKQGVSAPKGMPRVSEDLNPGESRWETCQVWQI